MFYENIIFFILKYKKYKNNFVIIRLFFYTTKQKTVGGYIDCCKWGGKITYFSKSPFILIICCLDLTAVMSTLGALEAKQFLKGIKLSSRSQIRTALSRYFLRKYHICRQISIQLFCQKFTKYDL